MPPLTINFTDADGKSVHVEDAGRFHTRSSEGGGIGVIDGRDAGDKAQVYARGGMYDEHLHFLDRGEHVVIDLETGERLEVSKP